jgi:hypothetical protein
MLFARTQKRIVLFLLLPALAFYLGMRLVAQYRHVDVYVSRVAPMPQELASQLHLVEHKIDPMVAIDTPYDRAENKLLTLQEIRLLRSHVAWSRAMPPFIDSLTIETTTNVVARRTTSRFMLEYRLVRRGDRWLIESATRSPVCLVSEKG